MDIDMDKVRTENFLRIFRAKYGGSPSRLESETGYSANMVSQISGGSKKVRDKLARKLERDYLKLPIGTLDKLDASAMAQTPLKAQWPFSVSQDIFFGLPPKLQREIDEALTRMVIGAQAQQMLAKQGRRSSQ